MNYLREIYNSSGRVILAELMVEVAPNEFVNEKLVGLVRGQKPVGEVKAKNTPIGMSLSPWRTWLREDDIVRERHWWGITPVDKLLRLRYLP